MFGTGKLKHENSILRGVICELFKELMKANECCRKLQSKSDKRIYELQEQIKELRGRK